MKKFLYIFLSFTCFLSRAQDLPLYNQYFHDYILINPAFTGKNNCFSVNIADHHQWLGINSAPNTQALYINTRVNPKKSRVSNYHGIGAMVARDQNGPYSQLGFSATYSYHILMSKNRNTFLSFALKGEIFQSVMNQSVLHNYYNDPLVTGERLSAWNPGATFAIAVYNPNYFAGITVADILPQITYLSDPVEAELNRRHYFFIAGFRTYKRNDFSFEPGLVYKTDENLQNQVDINCKMFYKDMLWAGISYRRNLNDFPGSTITLLPAAGIAFKNLEINYAYGLAFNNLQSRSLGSHYLHIAWKLCKETRSAVPCPAYE